MFSIFYDKEKLLEYLVEKITNLEDSSTVYRRLFSNLITPVNRIQTCVAMKEHLRARQCNKKKSIFKWSYQNESTKDNMQRKRELLLRIALKCNEFQIDHIIDCTEDLIELVEKDTPISREIIEHCLFETAQSRQIKELNWNQDQVSIAAFQMDTTFIN